MPTLYEAISAVLHNYGRHVTLAFDCVAVMYIPGGAVAGLHL